jgi:hypothetical protein
MRYHDTSVALIEKPLPAGDANRVASAEERLGVRFPASVREWYSAIDGRDVLSRYSNDDIAFEPEDFRLECIGGKKLIAVLLENQGVCWWGFELDAGDDPPVYVDLNPPPDNLFVYSSSFSEFTFVRIFDHEGFWDSDRFSLDTFPPLTTEDLEFLKQKFAQQPSSKGWPGTDTYRFLSELGRITIWQSKEQADWTLSTKSPAALAQLRGEVAHLWRSF